MADRRIAGSINFDHWSVNRGGLVSGSLVDYNQGHVHPEANSTRHALRASTTAITTSMPTRIPLIIHERLANWGRQLRPRTSGWAVRVIETRSREDLLTALAQAACPLIVIDLCDRPRAALEDLAIAHRIAPNALALVIASPRDPEIGDFAREWGASQVLRGAATPPEVVELLRRWYTLAQIRTDADGWSSRVEPRDDEWDATIPPAMPPAPPDPDAPRDHNHAP